MPDDDLETALQDIDGIGEARAAEIMDVVREHRDDLDALSDLDDLSDLLEDALAYHEQGDDSYGYKFVRQALDAL